MSKQDATAAERREWVQDVVAHLLAIISVLGFYAIIFFALAGYVNLENQTVSLFVGSAMGYAAAKSERVMARYYRAEMKADQKDNDDMRPNP